MSKGLKRIRRTIAPVGVPEESEPKCQPHRFESKLQGAVCSYCDKPWFHSNHPEPEKAAAPEPKDEISVCELCFRAGGEFTAELRSGKLLHNLCEACCDLWHGSTEEPLVMIGDEDCESQPITPEVCPLHQFEAKMSDHSTIINAYKRMIKSAKRGMGTKLTAQECASIVAFDGAITQAVEEDDDRRRRDFEELRKR